jgi:antitoxin component YwqK of YwqJK toxin-antitoxin module
MNALGSLLKLNTLNKIFVIAFFSFKLLGCGSKVEVTNYDRLKVVKTSRDSLFYLNDQLFSGEVYHNTLHGMPIRFFEVKEGKLNGEYRTFDAKGSLGVSTHYYKGLLHGPWLAYKGDQVTERMNYNYHLMHGKRELYWENGVLKEENYFDHGILTGRSNFFYSNGKLRKTFAFDDKGQPHGAWIDYDYNGKIIQKISYCSGKIIDTIEPLQ